MYKRQVIHLPQAPYGRTIAFTGAMAFLFCTCIEVGQTLVSMLAGGAGLLDFVQSFCWGGVGLCGLVCMLYASGQDRKELPLFRIPADNKTIR